MMNNTPNCCGFPTRIYHKAVAEFLLNLKGNEYTTNTIDPSTGGPVYVSLLEVAKVFELPKEGEELLSNIGLAVEDEYIRFAAKQSAVWSQRGKNMREDLESPFNYIGELFTKSVACHIGGLGQMIDNKIFAITAIVDSLSSSKFNWSKWFIQQIQEAAKDFEREPKNPYKIIRKGKLRFLGKLSYALDKLYPNLEWTNTHQYKKINVFLDLIKPDRPLVDGGLLMVDVRSAVTIP